MGNILDYLGFILWGECREPFREALELSGVVALLVGFGKDGRLYPASRAGSGSCAQVSVSWELREGRRYLIGIGESRGVVQQLPQIHWSEDLALPMRRVAEEYGVLSGRKHTSKYEKAGSWHISFLDDSDARAAILRIIIEHYRRE